MHPILFQVVGSCRLITHMNLLYPLVFLILGKNRFYLLINKTSYSPVSDINISNAENTTRYSMLFTAFSHCAAYNCNVRVTEFSFLYYIQIWNMYCDHFFFELVWWIIPQLIFIWHSHLILGLCIPYYVLIFFNHDSYDT